MTQRGASAPVIAEAAQSANQPVHLVELYLDGATTYATDAWRTLEWNGNIYLANGTLLDFTGIEETADLTIPQVTISLSGVDQSMIALVLAHEYVDRRVVIRRGFIGAAGELLINPIPIFDGRADAPEIHEDPDAGTSIVTLAASAQWVDFERKPGRHTNHAEQQIWFPGDKGFEYVAQLNKEIKWGSK